MADHIDTDWPTWTLEEQAAHRQQWIEALLSGLYTQTSGTLHDEGGYCCLGVATEISGLADWRKEEGEHGQVYAAHLDESGEVEVGVLPQLVRDWLGLETAEGSYVPDDADGRASLAELNDGGDNFETIAKVIESAPHGLVSPLPVSEYREAAETARDTLAIPRPNTQAAVEEPDFTASNHGSLILLTPLSESAQEWTTDNIPDDATWWAGAVAIEPRYFEDIADGIIEVGLTLAIN